MNRECEFQKIRRPDGQCSFVCVRCRRPAPPGSCSLAVTRECRPKAKRSRPRIVFESQESTPDLPCVHRGEKVRTEPCQLCGQADRKIPVYACGVHGECALSRTRSGSKGEIRQCLTCRDRKEEAEVQAVDYSSDWRWLVGITTAPRKQPTLERTVASLRAAGWRDPHVFAEPGVSPVSGCTWHANATRLGGWPNFVHMARVLTSLESDAILLLQDDVLLSPGLRQYLESTPWPKCGALSPYTSSIYARDGWGWKKIKYHGLVGALAFVIRPHVLKNLLTSRYARETQSNGIDTFFGRWIVSQGGLLFHQPSLAEHIGDTSTIHGRAKNRGQRLAKTFLRGMDLSKIVRPPLEGREPRIGLVGWNTASGLGSCTRDAARNLPISRWLVPKHDRFPTLGKVGECEVIHSKRHDANAMRRFLLGLDAVLAFETEWYNGLLETARGMRVRSVVVAMSECLPPGCKGWPKLVDCVISPTLDCQRQVGHVLPQARYLPWPIDTQRFAFRQRTTCNRFVFSQGTGGRHDRKGGDIVAAAARLAPEAPITVYTQMGQRGMRLHVPLTNWPSHVDVRGMLQDETRLYDTGDVAVQPSRYEGLGLSLLESQACGLPLVTTDGPPMNEYEPFRVIPSTARKYAVKRETTGYDADPHALAETLRSLLGADLRHASLSAREFVERERSWDARRNDVLDLLCSRQLAAT